MRFAIALAALVSVAAAAQDLRRAKRVIIDVDEAGNCTTFTKGTLALDSGVEFPLVSDVFAFSGARCGTTDTTGEKALLKKLRRDGGTP